MGFVTKTLDILHLLLGILFLVSGIVSIFINDPISAIVSSLVGILILYISGKTIKAWKKTEEYQKSNFK